MAFDVLEFQQAKILTELLEMARSWVHRGEWGLKVE